LSSDAAILRRSRERVCSRPARTAEATLEDGISAGLRLHKFKANSELPPVRRVLGILQRLSPNSLLDIGSGRGTFKVMGTPNKLAQVLRDAVIPIVSHLAPFQHAFVKRLSELGIAYQSATSMTRWLLGQPERLRSNSCESRPGIVELRPSGHSGIKLVRPDGYVAYSAHHGDGDGMAGLERVRKHPGTSDELSQRIRERKALFPGFLR